MKLRNKFLLMILSCLPVLSQSQTTINDTSYPIPGEITIMAYDPTPEGIQPTKQAFQDLVDCGFNMGLASGSIEDFEKIFTLIEGMKFKYIINNSLLFTDRRGEIINKFRENPNLGGWFFKDEPRYEMLPELRLQYKTLNEAVKPKLLYMNLIGCLMTIFTGPYKTYYDYLEYMDSEFQPEIWSFDNYPISLSQSKPKADLESFYSSLEAISAISKKSNRPFWSCCQSMSFINKSISRPAATEPYLTFEVFSALAYGAQGISYWTYGQRKSTALETYTSALLNLDGKKTKAWYAAQKVNRSIKKFNDVFYQCDVKEVRHTGDKIYKDTKKLSGEIGFFKMVRSGEAGVLVSYIENKGEKYMVIVNHDVFNKQKVTLELKPNINVINLINNKQYSWRKDISLTLGKGGFVILKEV